MHLGVPPVLRGAHELSLIDRILESASFPPRLAIEARIQRCLAKYNDAMLGDMEGSVRETLVQMCDRELEHIPLSLSGNLDSHLAFSFFVAKLHVYTLALLKEVRGAKNKRRFDPYSRGATFRGLGMTAANRVVDIYCNSLDASATKPESHLINSFLAMPKAYFRGVLLATFFLLKYFALNTGCIEEDRSNARNKISMVYAKLKEIAPHPFSEHGRAATVIELLCRHGDTTSTDPWIDVEDHAGASVTWSALILSGKIGGRGWKRAILEKTMPISPPLGDEISEAAQGSDFTPDSEMLGSALSHESGSLSEDIWDQPFLDLLDFNPDELNRGDGNKQAWQSYFETWSQRM